MEIVHKNNPFSYDMVEQEGFESFYTQRKAVYKKPAEEKYQSSSLEAYVENIESPTPQIMEVDGYKSEEEAKEQA